MSQHLPSTTGESPMVSKEEGSVRRRSWLAGVLGRDPRLAGRLVYFYGRLREMDRARQRIARRAAGTLAGAALLLALSGAPLHAATITVASGEVNIADNGKCSLIEAIANANDTTNGRPYDDCAAGAPAGADLISLPSSSVFSIEDVNSIFYGYSGLPAITTEITIQGNGSTIQRVGDDPFRLVSVAATGKLNLDNVAMVNGFAESDYGGAILAYGDLTIRDSIISNNESGAGGGIFAYGGEVEISGSQFYSNSAGSGSSLSLQYVTATINDAIISGNSGQGSSGAALYLLDGEATIVNSTISENNNTDGGGLMARDSTLTIAGSRILDNTTASGNGGGVYLYNAQATVNTTTISGNAAANGGGVYQYDGSLLLTQSLIAANDATTGGGVMNGKGGLTIANTTLSGNTAASGAGIANQAIMVLENATVTGNTATGNGGGIQNLGGTAELTIRRSLVAGNTAGGQGREVFHAGKAIAGNHFNGFGFNGNNGVFGFTPTGDSFTPAGPLAGVLNPTLGNNGGSTQTHALPAGSPAIDRSPSAECMAAPVGGVDQRGQPRNQNANNVASDKECDVGAVEATGTIAPVWRVFVPGIHRP